MFDDPNGFTVAAQAHPLRPIQDGDIRALPEGLTVAQILAEFDLPERFGLPVVELVFQGRRSEVSIADWGKVRPRKGVRVEIGWRVQGAAVGVLLSAIVSQAAPAIAAAALGAGASAFALAAMTAAISIVGTLVVNALIPPVSPSAATGAVGDTNYAITGSANERRPYGVFPRVLGRRRIYPPMTARGFTEVIDGEIFYRGRYTFGWGPLALEDLRIGTTPISEFEDVEIEFLNVDEARTLAAIPEIADQVTAWRSGVEAMTLYPDDVAEDPESVRLLPHTPTVRVTRERCTSASIDISFNQGLAYIKDTDDLREMSVDFHFSYRRVGDEDFVEAGSMTCAAAERSLVRFTHRIEFPVEGEYEVRVERLTEDSDDIDRPDDSYLSAVRSFRAGRLPSHSDIAEIAIRVRATEQLNGQIDRLSATVQQLAPVWDGSAWSAPQPVRHPAWIYARELMGPHLRRPVASGRIAPDALKAWADQEPHWTCDYVIDTAMRVGEVLDVVCATGRARRSYVDGRFSIVRDGAAGPVRQMFTPRNSWGFRGNVSFPREIHGFRVRVRSERLEWEQDEVTVYADGYGPDNATEFETLDLPGVVITKDDAAQGNAWRLGRYHLAVAKLRPESFQFNADWEHIRITRGDKIALVHDVPQVGHGWGRVVSVVIEAGYVRAFELDDARELAAGSYSLVARSALGEMTRFDAEFDAGAWTVPSSVVAEGLINDGDMVGIIELGSETLELVVTGIEPSSDETALIRAVPASPAVLAADGGSIPDYDPQITDLGNRYGPPLASVLQVVTGRAVAVVSRDGALTPRIGLDLIPRGYTSEVRALVRWRRPGQQAWQVSQPQSVSGTILTSALEDGVQYQIEVQTIDAEGRGRGFVAAGSHQARARNFDYVAPVGWRAQGTIGAVVFTGDPYLLEDFAHFVIYGASDESDDLTLLGRPRDAWFHYDGALTRFRVAAMDHSGNESPQTDWITAVPRGVAVEDLGGSVMELFDDINASIEQVQADITEAVDALTVNHTAAVQAVESVAAQAAAAALSEEAAASSAAEAGERASASTAAANASEASATEAGESASAASVQRQQAQTARGQAQSFAQQSAASADDAGEASTAAASSAGVATAARNAGQAYASAAAGSASAAESSATDAGQYATSSNNSRVAAETARGQAVASATQAAGSANSAEGSAQTAAQTLSVFARAGGQAGNLAPFHHEYDSFSGTGWTQSFGEGISGSPGGGEAVRLADGAAMRPAYSGALSGRRMRVSAWVEVTDVTEGLTFCLRGGNAPGDTTILAQISSNVALGPGWRKVEFETVVTTDANYWSPGIDLGLSTDRILISNLVWEDITDEHALNEVKAEASIAQAAIADLQGNAAASITMRAQAGSSGARLELVAADAPNGGASDARISADNIILNGSVRTPHLAAGAVTADRLAIAFGGNLLRNSDLAEGLLGWAFGGSSSVRNQSSMRLRPPGDWSGADYSVLELYQNGTQQSGYADIRSSAFDVSGNTDFRSIAVRGDQWYEFSVQCSMHRTRLRLLFSWYDLNGDWIGHGGHGKPGFEDFSGPSSSRTNPEEWPRYRITCRAPSNAAFAAVFFRNEGTTGGQNYTDSYLFLHKPFFGETTSNASEPAPWSPGPKNVWDGAGLLARSIRTDLGVFDGPLRSGNYEAGVTGWQIDENGSAEFANMVARSWMRVGSVSDGVTVVNTSARALDDGDIITERNLGPTTLDQFWQIAVSLKYRARAKGNTGQNSSSGGNSGQWRNYVDRTRVRLLIRRKIGSTWSSWSELADWDYRSSTTWRQINTVQTVHGVYADVGLRLVVDVARQRNNSDSQTQPASYKNIDDYSLVAKAVVR